jgi:antitoxin CptB
MTIKNRSEFIKKLLYQSCNRGCKETDQIIGQFAKANIDKMTDSELEVFSEILAFADIDIYDWYTKKIPIPEQNKSKLMMQMLNFDLSK